MHLFSVPSSAPFLRTIIAALVDGAALVGNPAALHTSGRRARSLLEDAREQLAEAVVRQDELENSIRAKVRAALDGGADVMEPR